MREIYRVFKTGWMEISSEGRRVLSLYGGSLTALALLDALALYILSTAILNSNTSNLQLDGIGIDLAIIIFLFLLRSAMATGISYWGVRHFAEQEVQLGSKSFANINSKPWNQRQTITAVDLYSAVDRGPNSMVQGVLISAVTLVTEFASGIVILAAILFMQPLTAIIALVYFTIIALIQHRVLSVASQSAGQRVTEATQATYQLLTDANALAKLLAVTKSETLPSELRRVREKLAHARASSTFLALLPRYFMESVLAMGFLVVAGFSYIYGGSQAAAASVTVFAAAGFRLLPIVNRIQGLILFIFSQLPTAELTHLKPITKLKSIDRTVSSQSDDEIIRLENVTYSYPLKNEPALRDINLVLQRGLQYAVVGPSGAGKTTLVDVCLGLLQPQTGSINSSNIKGNLRIGYVPQETYLIAGSTVTNVSLEWIDATIDLDSIARAIDLANLADVLNPEEISSDRLGAGGNSLSGGQKQRIGLARALYQNPDLLVLDEATSALDSETEYVVMKTINSLRGKSTVLIVAHRLSTVKDVDQVIYLSNGEIKGIGTFDELRRIIPEFARQIELGSLDLA